jgi:hypothetical protein
MEKRIGGGGGGGPGQGSVGPLKTGISGFGSWDAGIGKSLYEPVSPYRFVTIFGADLNTPNADGWNTPPNIGDPGTSYDLSSITPNHEVIVAKITLFNVDSNTNNITFRWYRNRDNALLYTGSIPIPDPVASGYAYWAWYYGYSYIGYVPWEIYENGDYRVEISVNSTILLWSATFIVSGIATQPTDWVKMGNPTERQIAFADIGFDWTKMGASIALAITKTDLPFDWTKMGAALTRAVTVGGGTVEWVKMGSPSVLGITVGGGTIDWVKMGVSVTRGVAHVDVTPPGGGTPGWLLPVVVVGGAALIGIAAASADKSGKVVGRKR